MLATNDDNVSSHILIIFNFFIYCKFRYAKPEQINHTSFRYLVLKSWYCLQRYSFSYKLAKYYKLFLYGNTKIIEYREKGKGKTERGKLKTERGKLKTERGKQRIED